MARRAQMNDKFWRALKENGNGVCGSARRFVSRTEKTKTEILTIIVKIEIYGYNAQNKSAKLVQ